MNEVRILHLGLCTRVYGTERVVLNLYRAIDRRRYQFDFLCDHRHGRLEYEEELMKLGGNIYYQFYTFRERYVDGCLSPEEFFEQHPEIRGVHLHVNVYHFSQFRYVIAAKKKGLPIRIIHSHNSQMVEKSLKNYVNKTIALLLRKKYSNKFLACSTDAGKWNFGKTGYEILPNGIDVEKYKFDKAVREKLRKKYCMENKLVLGFAGRLDTQKNPAFLLKVLQEINKKRDDAILFILGDGELETKLRTETEKENLENIFFAGRVDNVHEWFQAFDVLLLPSLFEGLGLVLIEAQAGGLMCIASEHVPKEAAVTGRISFVNIEKAEDWADKILETDFLYDRKKGAGDVAAAGYDVKDSAKRLEEIYREAISE